MIRSVLVFEFSGLEAWLWAGEGLLFYEKLGGVEWWSRFMRRS